jgi:heme/copper-type cytochrome/quinol oxidase subunit 1
VIFVICAAFYFWCERAWGGRYDDRLGIAHLALFSLGAALLFAAPYGLLSATGEMVTAAGQRSAIAWMNGISLAGAVAFLTGGVAWVLVIVRGLHPPRPAEAA